MRYRFRALASNGSLIQGVVEADDQYAALAQLRDQQLTVKQLKPIRKITELLNTEIGPEKVSEQVLAILCTQFSVLLKTGFSVPFCLDLLSSQTKDRKLKRLLKKTERHVEAGSFLADSFVIADRNAFPETFIETVRAGEQSGTLDEIFRRLAAYYEKRSQLKQKISAAMMYPGFVLAVALVVIGIVLVMAVPTMSHVFLELEAELPLSTRILIGVSEWFVSYWFQVIVCILGLIVVGLWYVRTERGRLWYGHFLLRMPVWGTLHMLEASGQFAHTMSVLLNSGVNLAQALFTTARTLENYDLASAISRMAVSIVEGGCLGDCMRREACFPDVLIEVCATGEETGKLEELLESIGVYYESQLEFASKKALSMLEPVLLVLLAMFVGFVVMSVYIPMFTMYEFM